jgi:alpha-1,6-mannosyltransferase
MAWRRGVLLLGAGLVSEAVYMTATVALPWWRYGGTLSSWSQILGDRWLPFGICLAGIAVLVAAYLLGWRAVRLGGATRRAVWVFAILFAATLFWLMPITSDLFSYLSQVHLLTDLGVNPLLVAPLDAQVDRLLLAYPAFYADYPTVYGPAWLLLSAPATLGRYDVAGGLIYLKGLVTLSYLGCAWLVERILRQVRPESALLGLYLFAWNPLVLLMSAGDGHNDMVMMAGVVLSLWLLLGEHRMLAFGVLTVSVWIKYVSVIFLALFALYTWRQVARERGQRAWSGLVPAGLVVAGVSALLLIPFYGLESWPAIESWAVGIAGRLMQPANWGVGGPELSTRVLGAGLFLFVVAYGLLAWWLVRGAVRFRGLADACFVVALLAFVLAAARSQPWHLIWPAALAGLSHRRWAWPVVAGLSAVMLWGQVWVEWGAPGIEILS